MSLDFTYILKPGFGIAIQEHGSQSQFAPGPTTPAIPNSSLTPPSQRQSDQITGFCGDEQTPTGVADTTKCCRKTMVMAKGIWKTPAMNSKRHFLQVKRIVGDQPRQRSLWS